VSTTTLTPLPEPLDTSAPFRPANPEELARVDACLADLSPQMREALEEAERLDRIDDDARR
jgi:hypothetical protein